MNEFTAERTTKDIAKNVAKEMGKYTYERNIAKATAKLKASSFETKLKTIERPKEEAKVKQKSFSGEADTFFGKILSTNSWLDNRNDIKITLKK